jgi:hypothetical protein
MLDLYGPMRDVARKYLKSIPHTQGVPTQGEVDDLTRLLCEVVDREREASAAYCLDRADQYATSSPCGIAVSDCAQGIAKGDAWESMRTGETEDLLVRVRSLAGIEHPTPPPKRRPALPRHKTG